MVVEYNFVWYFLVILYYHVKFDVSFFKIIV